MTLGEKIKSARLAAGLSQRQLCGDTITRNMLSQIENGTARPSMDTLSHFARQLGKPISWFLEEQSQTEKQDMEQGRQLLQMVRLMDQAKAAVKEGKPLYAVSLLEQARQAGEQIPYFTEAVRREWTLIMYSAQPDKALTLESELPQDHREIYLRAQAAIDRRDYLAAAGLLDGSRSNNTHWHYLRAQAALGQKDYALAIRHYRLAEADYPAPCARALEQCYRELEDYKLAYYYACKQRDT